MTHHILSNNQQKGGQFYAGRLGWQPGMRLEAVDKKHPSLICVATILSVSEYE
jgi:hypothetical protein